MQAKAEDEVMYDAQAEDTDSEEGGDELQNSMQPDPPAKTILGLTYASAFKIGITIILIGGVVLGLTVWDLDERMRSLLEWLEDNKVEGITIFVALYMALTGMAIPHEDILLYVCHATFSFQCCPARTQWTLLHLCSHFISQLDPNSGTWSCV